jgi:glycosyltransferase involved in cell wall biosynthesis
MHFREQGIHTPMIAISTGLNLKDYPLKENTSVSSLFFIGALDWLPNQEGLIWFLDLVFTQLVEEEPGIHLHVAGRNAPMHFVEKLKHPNILFHGEVEDAQLFMQSYGIMVAPLFSGSGIRIKILEAMALGRPLVTTSTGIEGIPAANLPSVLVSDHPGEFKELLLKLIRKPEEAASMAVEARKLINREFNILELSKRLHTFYQAQA